MKRIIIALLLLSVTCHLSLAQIGSWKNYMAYSEIQQIQVAGDDVFVLSSNDLWSYNKNDQSITTYDKANQLSDTYITHIAWNKQAKCLVAVYQNANVDLVEANGNVTNISDIYTKVLTGDKTVYGIYINSHYAYLSCGFGIVKVNVRDAEIAESYMLGFRIDHTAVSGDRIYAKAHDGNVWIALLSDNLIDTNNWQTTATYPTDLFAEDTSDYDDNYAVASTLLPGGPKYNYFGFMRSYNGRLYTCGGGYGPWNELYRPGTIQVLENDEWIIYEDSLQKKTDVQYLDLLSIDVDPLNENHVFASGRTGLYEFNNGRFVKLYNMNNSILESALTSRSAIHYVLVESVKFDQNGNLWALNSSALTQSIVEYTKEGEWVSHHQTPQLMYDDRGHACMISLHIDSRNLLWFVNNHWRGPSFYCYDMANDVIYSTNAFITTDGGSLSNCYPRCITEDKSGNMWVGTNLGPFMIEPSEMMKDNSILTQVKVPRNDGTDYADYLLSGLDISCIAIDGGGRKWFGTNGNGVYLISADNMEQLQHFTAENSSLLSNNIESIAINDQTGEVFFGTSLGLCSYMSDATTTNDEMDDDKVWAYPNPVDPSYTGLITVVGLSLNADVKILTSSGVLVAEGRSNGGTFTWDGCDQKGKRVASGVYMVVTATSEGKKGVVCKIAVVR